MKTSEQLLNDLLVEHCSPEEKQQIKDEVIRFVIDHKNKYDSIQIQLLADYLNCSLTLNELHTRIEQLEKWK
jgi:hypothetical protein